MRRNTKAALVVLGLGVATVGLTTAPGPGPDAPEADPPAVVAEAAPTAAIVSSTRGTVAVEVESTPTAGRPFDPGGQTEAATDATGPTPAGVEVASAATEGAAESVIGADGRVWLRERTTVYPNAAIGRLDFRQSGGTYWCTGTLIDADTVLTAGHCVHDGLTDADGWSTSVRFTPGAEGNRAPFGSCRSRELLTLPDWYEEGREYQDLGLVQLDCTIGDTVGWFGYRGAEGVRGLSGVRIHVRGYPGDKAWSSLWTMADRVRVSQREMAFYAADTYGGQSGSPVFTANACNGAVGPCIVAVHAYGAHSGGAHARFNHGPRLTLERIALFAALAAG
jgi:glutamyl endopeptidase